MKILHLEDNPTDAELVREVLALEFPGCSVEEVETRERFLAGLAPGAAPDLILSDFSLPGFDGLSALALARELAPATPFVFLSGSIGEERAIAAVRAGAYDYVLKDNTARLCVVVRRAVDDFARRRLAEADQRRLLELAGIIERAGEAIMVSDLTGRITLWNDGAARLYGVSAAETVGRTAEEIFPGNGLAEARAAHESTLAGEDWRRELNVTTRDGRELVVDFRVTLVRDALGRAQARLVIATDVTEKKRLEEQFLRAQRIESLGMLAAGIAHDFNNVLAPLEMVSSLLRPHLADPGDLRMLEILEKSAERGTGLVRQILGFARGVGGGFQPTQIKHLLRDVGEIIRASFPKSIALELKGARDLRQVQANPTQIHQVLLNLAVNARDAMLPRGGTLRIGAENRTLDESAARALEGARAGEFLVLEVADTGAGIGPEVLARIWEPFFTTKGDGKGTGLGLSTVRGIAVAHGGFVTVSTRVGLGTAFSVFLPAAQSTDERLGSNAAPAPPRGRGEVILVVEDEADVRDVIVTILTQHGYRTIACGDGIEALGEFAARKAEIQAVVSDLNMPKLDGPSLARIILSLRPGMKLLAMTGLESGEEKGAAESELFAARLPKPFTAEALLGAVGQLLEKDPPLAPAEISPPFRGAI